MRDRGPGGPEGGFEGPLGGVYPPPETPSGVACYPSWGFMLASPPPPSGRAAPQWIKGVSTAWGWRCTGDQACLPAGCCACHSFGSVGVFSLGVPAPGNGACLPSRGFMRRIYGYNGAPILILSTQDLFPKNPDSSNSGTVPASKRGNPQFLEGFGLNRGRRPPLGDGCPPPRGTTGVERLMGIGGNCVSRDDPLGWPPYGRDVDLRFASRGIG